MLTYQVRPRTFRFNETPPRFPADCQVQLHLRPLQAFGLEAGGGRTAIRGVAATAMVDANTGSYTVKSANPLKPLEVIIDEGSVRRATLAGNILNVSQRIDNPSELAALVESLYFGFPLLLNVVFADPPYVERVDGTVGGVPFRWELSAWRMDLQTTTQDKQESLATDSWLRMEVLAAPHRRRLLAGLHHFHIACRLAREGVTAGEFIAEAILNLSKTLEVLFPPTGDGHTRDAARNALLKLGFDSQRVERDFIPAMALRNEIDVGHVELGLFTPEHLKYIHAYTDRAEAAFREMLKRLLDAIANGEFDVAPYDVGPARAEALALIERLKQNTPKDAV